MCVCYFIISLIGVVGAVEMVQLVQLRVNFGGGGFSSVWLCLSILNY